jgi:hypothetical protein
MFLIYAKVLKIGRITAAETQAIPTYRYYFTYKLPLQAISGI